MDNKNITDWISAASNFAMALAAIYAAFNANRWFSQRSHTKGFDKAEEILSQIDSNFRITAEGIKELHATLELLTAVANGMTRVDSTHMDKYDELINYHNGIIKSIDRLSEEVQLIERWSIEIKNDHLIQTTIKHLRNCHVSASHAYNSARSAVYNVNYIGIDEFRTMYGHFKTIYAELLSEIAESESHYDDFKRQKFTNFFKVK
ncbi:hypothetical protein [Citrobacter sp. UYEF32]|uniref:hypothetical protein n=1 Tax=Citrobacter sp. UYEF32 TaxID=3156347 RepID=UPI00339B4226